MKLWQNVVVVGLLCLTGAAVLWLGYDEAGLMVLGGAVGFATQARPAP